MYTLVIIDDEESILEQLSELFDWSQLGFQLVKSFSNVHEFIEYSNHNTFAVLLADIRLGHYSGLDLAKSCKQKNPDLEIILISAYSEFDFAKEAIHMKVFDYLLKPITYKSVTDCFLSLKDRLDQTNTKKSDLARKEKKFLLIDRRQTIFDFMSGMSTQTEALELSLQKSGLTVTLENNVFFQVTGILPFDSESSTEQNILTKYGREGFCFAMDNFCADICNSSNYLLLLPGYLSNQKIIALLIADSSHCSDSYLRIFFEQLTENLKELLNLSVSFTLSKRADHLLDPCLLIKNRNVIYGNIQELAHLIRAKLTENNKQSAFLLLRWGFEDYSDNLQSALTFAQELITNLADGQEYIQEKQIPWIRSIQSASTGERIYTYMQEYLASLLLFYQSTESNLYQIEMAKQYIVKNYMMDICLNDVASHVSLNPVYFSRFFKKNTGEGFIDFLCKVRMEHAILLLKDPQNKAYEICNLVGYKSKKHFYKLFKLYTGHTPIEYRNQSICPVSPITEPSKEVTNT